MRTREALGGGGLVEGQSKPLAFLAGHADKRGTPEYNRALGDRRALAVREYMVGLGVPASILFTNSYGSDRPAAQGDTEEAYAKNRRVEIGVIVKP